MEGIRGSISDIRSLHVVISVWFTDSTGGHITWKQDGIILLAEMQTKACPASCCCYKSHWGIALSGSVLHHVVFQLDRCEYGRKQQRNEDLITLVSLFTHERTSQQFKDMGGSVKAGLPDCGSQQWLCHSGVPRPQDRLGEMTTNRNIASVLTADISCSNQCSCVGK